MICDYCGGKTKKRHVRKHHVYKKRLYVVEKVPAEVCQECGERYYHAKTLDAIDMMLAQAHPVKARLEVEVVSM
jgi:YgiT-type zinc finger domain-containing protein